MFINIILTIVIYVVLFLLLSDFEIEFNPFKIKFNFWNIFNFSGFLY